MYDAPMFAPQGWVCPVCHRVYAPNFPWCTVCGNQETTMTTNTEYETKKAEFVRKIMVGDTPETMKQQTTGGKVK